MSVDFVNLSMTRRKLIKGAACSAAAASAPSLVNHAFAEQIAKLEKEGWSKHPVACTMCGAYCGILAMRKEGEPIQKNRSNFSEPRTSSARLLRPFCRRDVDLEPPSPSSQTLKTYRGKRRR